MKQAVRWVLFAPDANAMKGPLPQGYGKVEDIPYHNPVGNNSGLHLALEFQVPNPTRSIMTIPIGSVGKWPKNEDTQYRSRHARSDMLEVRRSIYTKWDVFMMLSYCLVSIYAIRFECIYERNTYIACS